MHQHAKSAPLSCKRSGTLPAAWAQSNPTRAPTEWPASVMVLRSKYCPKKSERKRGREKRGRTGLILNASKEDERHLVPVSLDSRYNILCAQCVLTGPWGDLHDRLGWLKAVDERL